MENYISYMVVWVVAFVFGWVMREYTAMRKVDRLLKNLEKDLSEKVMENVVHVIIERTETGFYVYNKETKEFMAQGVTRLDLETNLDKRYPGKKFAASDSNLKEVGFAK